MWRQWHRLLLRLLLVLLVVLLLRVGSEAAVGGTDGRARVPM